MVFLLLQKWDNISYFGLDFFENESPVLNTKGYLTDLLTDRAKQGNILIILFIILYRSVSTSPMSIKSIEARENHAVIE